MIFVIAIPVLIFFPAYVFKWYFQYEFLRYVIKHPEVKEMSFYEFSYTYFFLSVPFSWKFWLISPFVFYNPFASYRNSPDERKYQSRFRFLGIVLNGSWILLFVLATLLVLNRSVRVP